MRWSILGMVACAILSINPASARHHRHHGSHGYIHHHHKIAASAACVDTGDIMHPCMPNIFSGFFNNDQRHKEAAIAIRPHRERPEKREVHHDSFERTVVTGNYSTDRPKDCYGIPWCGCYLRHVFGLADKGLNLAINWARVGIATTAHAGAIAVWHGHVGLLKSDPDQNGRALLLSGNDGNRVRVRSVSLRRVVAFRSL